MEPKRNLVMSGDFECELCKYESDNFASAYFFLNDEHGINHKVRFATCLDCGYPIAPWRHWNFHLLAQAQVDFKKQKEVRRIR